MLTALQVKNAKTGEHADGNNLYLRVSDTGAKSWVFRFQLDGKRRKMGLGSLDALPLAEARAKAAEFRVLVKQNIDPLNLKQADKREKAQLEEVVKAKAVTFGEACAAFIAAKEDGWRSDKHRQQWENTLKTYCAAFYNKPVGEVLLRDVEKALRPIWLTKSETASRVLQRVIVVMKKAKREGWSSTDVSEWSEDLVENLPTMPKKDVRVRNHPALPYNQISAFMADLRSKNSVGAKALEFVILTAARSGEVRLASWSEIDFDAAAWNVPASRMKAQKPHRVPLSERAVALLKEIRTADAAPDAYIFRGEKDGQPLSDMTLTACIRRRNEAELTLEGRTGRGDHRSRLSLQFPRLGLRDDALPVLCGRDGTGPHHQRQD